MFGTVDRFNSPSQHHANIHPEDVREAQKTWRVFYRGLVPYKVVSHNECFFKEGKTEMKPHSHINTHTHTRSTAAIDQECYASAAVL